MLNRLPVYIIITVFCFVNSHAKQRAVINWLSFEALNDSLNTNPKKVFIDFHTSWCTYCRKMDKRVFTNPQIVAAINREFYAVKMDAETTDTIRFDGQTFVNQQAKTKGKGIHQISQLLAQRNGEFVAPTIVILDKGFKVQKRYFEYLDSKKLLKALQQ